MIRKVIFSMLALGLYFGVIACSETMADTKSSKTPVYKIKSVSPAKSGYSVDFKFEQDGKSRSFAELTKGKVVFLNFWGTWCGPCRREIPDIIKISKELKNKDFVVIGIAYEQVRSEDDAVKKVLDFASKNDIEYINFIANRDIIEAYGKIPSVPTTFIIDKNGKLIEKIVGSRDKATFMNSINKVLK
ncbi:MAG: TlpA disulfide reductase family protein [Candidatus Kapaibacterium sp.]|jgi:thiol-disulfide isomerase/thioredoxin|nr:TlpA disulfide reductase family protein [Candidatus Kapabacteria bacterium]